jgi:hypothetical protein
VKPPALLKGKVFQCDAALVTGDKVRALKALSENESVFSVVSEAVVSLSEEERERLGEAEKVVLAMSEIPHHLSLWKDLVFCDSYSSRVASLSAQMDRVSSALGEIRDNRSFEKFLSYVLSYGNSLNAKSSRGNAYGFNLDDLAKLSDFKGEVNGVTTDLLEVIMKRSEEMSDRELPKESVLLSSFGKLLETKSLASESLFEAQNLVISIGKEALSVQTHLALYSHPDMSNIQRYIQDCYRKAEKEIFALDQKAKETSAAFVDLKKSFAESADCDSNTFFKRFFDFLAVYQRTFQRIITRQPKGFRFSFLFFSFFFTL